MIVVNEAAMTATDLLALAIFGGRRLGEISGIALVLLNRVGDDDLGTLAASSALAKVSARESKWLLQLFRGVLLGRWQ